LNRQSNFVEKNIAIYFPEKYYRQNLVKG